MSNGIKLIFTFAIGAAAGSVVTWKIIKDKYEQIANDEIASVKETFAKIKEQKDDNESSDEDTNEVEDDDKDVYEEICEEYTKGGSEMKKATEPYIITPEEFGEMGDEYELITLTYYADGVLTDDMDNVIEYPADLVCKDFASHYGQYEDDCVYVRNDRYKCDYEILKDLREYYTDMCTTTTSNKDSE